MAAGTMAAGRTIPARRFAAAAPTKPDKRTVAAAVTEDSLRRRREAAAPRNGRRFSFARRASRDKAARRAICFAPAAAQQSGSSREDCHMSASVSRLALAGLTCAIALPVSAQTLARKDLSLEGALAIATETIANCKQAGYAVSVTVVGRNGEPLVQLRGDGTGPHTVENSFKKSYTSRTFRIASGEMEDRFKKIRSSARYSFPTSPPGAARCRSRLGTRWSVRSAPPAPPAATRTKPASRPASTRSPTS